MPDSDNGKVTMALLGQKLDILTTAVERIDETQDEFLDFIRNNKENISLNKQCVDQNAKHLEELAASTNKSIEALNNRVNAWNSGNTIFAGIATILAIFTGKN